MQIVNHLWPATGQGLCSPGLVSYYVRSEVRPAGGQQQRGEIVQKIRTDLLKLAVPYSRARHRRRHGFAGARRLTMELRGQCPAVSAGANPQPGSICGPKTVLTSTTSMR